MKLLILVLCDLIFLIKNIRGQCFEFPFSKAESSLNLCGSPYVLDSTWPSFPSQLTGSGVSLLVIDVIFKVSHVCMPDSPTNLVAITIHPSGESEQNLMYFEFTGGIMYKIITKIGPSVSVSPSLIQFEATHGLTLGDEFEFLGSVDTNLQRIVAAVAVPGNMRYSSRNVDLGWESGWKFDSTTKFYICSNTDGSMTIRCSVKHFAVFQTYLGVDNRFQYFGGIYPNIIANYAMDEGFGTTIVDNQGSLGNAMLGADTPEWLNNEVGVDFSNADQYIEIPYFPIQVSNPSLKALVTVSFWLKITNFIPGYIFRYSSDSLLENRFSLEIMNNGSIKGTIGTDMGSYIPTKVSLPLSEWTIVTASFMVGAEEAASNTIFIFFGNTLAGVRYPFTMPTTSFTLTSNDQVRIGGPNSFIGSISNFRIYNPGSNLLNIQTNCPSNPFPNCPTMLGAPDLGSCVTYSCHSNCETCFDGTESGCLSCPGGSYLKNNACIGECPINANKVRIDERGNMYCDLLCDPSEFVSPGGECLLECDQPLRSFQDNNGIWFCEGPCDDNNIFYNPGNNSCSSSCSNSSEETDPFLYKICYDNDTVVNDDTDIGNDAVIVTESGAVVVGKGAQAATKTVVQALGLVSLGNPFAISASISGKIFSNIKYINISYSAELEQALENWDSSFVSFGLSPPMPGFVESDIEINSVPYVFEKYEVNATFIINFWDDFIFLCIYFGIFGIVKLFELFVPYFQSITQLIRKITQNFLLTQLYNIFGDYVLFSALDYRVIDTQSGTSIFSFSISLILMIFMFSCFAFHINILQKYQRIKIQSQQEERNKEKLSKFLKDNAGNQLFFREFKDTTITHQSFLLIFTIQDILFALILTTLFKHPLLETILILILNLTRVPYLLIITPFKDILDAGHQLFYEVIILSVNISVFILAIFDNLGYGAKDLRNKICKFIIITNLIFNFGTLLIIFVKGYLVLKDIWRSHKVKKRIHNQDKKVIDLNTSTQQNKNSLEIDLSLNQSTLSGINTNPSNRLSRSNRLFAISPAPLQFSFPNIGIYTKMKLLSRAKKVQDKDESITTFSITEIENNAANEYLGEKKSEANE